VASVLLGNGEDRMCEFNVFLNGKSQMKDVVYVKSANNNVTLKTIMGETKEIKSCRILEVDVNNQRLVLESVKA
jgi:predicted RNA-binding protein